MVTKICVLAPAVLLLLAAALCRADDDSDEFSFRTGRWQHDDDDSDERFGSHRRSSFGSSSGRNWRAGSSSSRGHSSWRRDDSDESDERWGGGSRWARPSTTRRTNIWQSNVGRPLNTGRWNAGNNHWSTNTIKTSSNPWTKRTTPSSKWASNNNNNKWQQNSGSSKWNRNNKWNTGRQTNSGKWNRNSNNNNSWNRKWW